MIDDTLLVNAINLGESIALDLLEPQKSIVANQIAAMRGLALKALRAFIDADPADVDGIRSLQNDVRLYRNHVRWLRNSQVNAANAFADLDPEDQLEVRNLLNPKYEINDL